MPKSTSTLRVSKYRAMNNIPYLRDGNESDENDDADMNQIENRLLQDGIVIKHENPLSDNEDNTDLGNIILKEIRSLRAEVQIVAEQQKTLLIMMEAISNTNYIGKKSFVEKYDLNLPFKSFEEFTVFENKLKTDEECAHRLKASLYSSLNKESGIRKALKLIIKKYLQREVVMKFTVVKKVLGKEVFKDFQFCTCIIDAVREKFEATEEEILSHISTIFWNAKDWDGNRKMRSQ